MSYFEIFFYCLSFASACGFVVHMAATVIISNLEDDDEELFPYDVTGILPRTRKTLVKLHKNGRRVVHYQTTVA